MKALEISRILHQLSDPATATQSRRFFKTGKGEYGEGDHFIGIKVPAIRKVARRHVVLSDKEILKLLQSKFHEERLCALLILVEQFQKATDDRKRVIFDLYLAQTQYVNNWDLVDCSAYQIIGKYLENKYTLILHQLSDSTSLWERRIAIVATFHFIRSGSFKDTLQISKRLLKDKEDLIHKAVGWMLREVGKRNLKTETEFLEEFAPVMPRTMLRYAIEKFPEKERRRFLSMDR